MSGKNDWIRRCFYDGNLGRFSRLISKRRASTVLGACLAVLVGMLLFACPSPGEEESKPKVTEIIITAKDANFIKLNKTITLSVEVTGTGDYDKSVTWSSSSDTVAVVENGTVTGKSAGTVTITATSVADTTVSGSIELEVKANYIDSVTIDGGNIELDMGKRKTLTAQIQTVGTVPDAEKIITWSSDQPEIASIDANSGELEAKAEGTAQIRAMAGGVSSMPISVKVLLKENYVDSVTIDGGNIELNIGDKKTLTAQIQTVGTVSEAEKIITWSSDQPEIASIDADSGELEAKAEGTAQIRATAGGVSSMPISVKVLFVESFTFSISYNNKEYRASKPLDVNADENSNIVTIFIDEDYDSSKALNLSVTATTPAGHSISPDTKTTRNYSDQTPEIFEISDGISTGKLRLHIIRRPIIIATKPAANTDNEYDSSGATALSIRRFVQTDYYSVLALIGDKVSNLPAPTFALFSKNSTPAADEILTSPVRILRNFSTNDGTTLFFSSIDDGIADDEWDTGENSSRLNPDADLRTDLSPETDYSLHWALDASNGKFSGSLGTVSTTALPTVAPTTGTGVIKYYGVGGMKGHPVDGLDFKIVAFVGTMDAFLTGSTHWFGRDGSSLTISGVSQDRVNFASSYTVFESTGGIYYDSYTLISRTNAALSKIFGGTGVYTKYRFEDSKKILIEIE